MDCRRRRPLTHSVIRRVATVLAVCAALSAVPAAPAAPTPSDTSSTFDNSFGIPDLSQFAPPAKDGAGISATLRIFVLLTVISLAPAVLIMMTSFTRIVIVLSLLRQAMGTQQ